MRQHGSISLFVGILIGFAGVGFSAKCLAQEQSPTTVQLNMDLRSLIAPTGPSQTALYSSSLLFKSRLAPGLQFAYDGGQSNARILTGRGGRFNRFITQEAALQ